MKACLACGLTRSSCCHSLLDVYRWFLQMISGSLESDSLFRMSPLPISACARQPLPQNHLTTPSRNVHPSIRTKLRPETPMIEASVLVAPTHPNVQTASDIQPQCLQHPLDTTCAKQQNHPGTTSFFPIQHQRRELITDLGKWRLSNELCFECDPESA